MPGKSKKGGGLEVKGPYKMKGSPHKLGTIEGTEVHKASMAKFTVEQTRTSGDATLVAAGSKLGGSYVPHETDYSIKTGFTVDSKGKKKKKKIDTLEDAPTEEIPKKELKKLQVKNGKGPITPGKTPEWNYKGKEKVGSVADWTEEDLKIMHGGGTKILKT